MPAKQTYIATDNNNEDFLRVEAEGDLGEREAVYFTNQSPTFTVTATNIGDKPIDGSTRIRISFDESSKVYERDSKSLDCLLEPGESNTTEFELDMLSYQGNAAITVDRVGATTSDDEYNMYTYTSDSHNRVYTFMVYDRDYYKVNYLNPRRAQYLAAVLSVGIIAVGVLQVTLTL